MTLLQHATVELPVPSNWGGKLLSMARRIANSNPQGVPRILREGSHEHDSS